MKKWICLLVCICFSTALLQAQEREVKLKIVQTSDVHGNYFPYDYIRRTDAAGSLARVHSLAQKYRTEYADRLILLDNGDILQGQPGAYYYNYIDTTSTHLTAEVMNFMHYDAANMGNHDIETGRSVFERWTGDCRFPVLGANIVDAHTGLPHCKPYEVFERDGIRIVVIGMITPAIPAWLSENLWRGLRFDDMEQTARRWIDEIRRKERPHLIVGLFHAGSNAQLMAGLYRENASEEVARRIPGFDVVLIGHDHTRRCEKIANTAGDSVLVVNPASHATLVSEVDVMLKLRGDEVVEKKISGALTPVDGLAPDSVFIARFAPQHRAILDFVSKPIGRFTQSISTRPAYFGPSAFVDLIHTLQLEIGRAEISLAAPLSFDAEIGEGEVYVSDMFNLYKYENMLYTMRLSGREIRNALEMSYRLWTHRMTAPSDHLLLLQKAHGRRSAHHPSFVNLSFNFDSAAGIIYTVDVTKPAGQKVNIVSMADGSPFDMNKMYKVALNSYRGNGGGELLTKGAGISPDELPKRIITSTDKDLRYYLMQYIERKKQIEPRALNQWKFIPEAWVQPAAQRDYRALFGAEK